MQPLFAYNALIWKNTITILTLILFVVFLVRGLYLFAVLGKHLLKSNQGFQHQQQARDIRNSFSRPSCLWLSLLSGPDALGLGAVCCFFCWPSAPRLAVRSCLFCVSRLAVGCFLVFAARPPLCVSRFLSLLLGALFFFSRFIGGARRLLPPPWCVRVALCCLVLPRCAAFPCCVAVLWCLALLCCGLLRAFRCLLGCLFLCCAALLVAVACCAVSFVVPSGWVVRGVACCLVLVCVAVCRAVLCVPGCCAEPRCCASCLPVLCCRVLCCFVAFVWCRCLLCRALWRCPSPWGPVLCGTVFCGVLPRFVLCAVCVLSWRAGACCCSPLCCVLCVSWGVALFPVLSALCGAVFCCAGALASCCLCGACCCWSLVLWCAAVCCAVSFGVLWCGAGSGGPWSSAGHVFRCRCPCPAAWSGFLWLVWFAAVPCFPVLCSAVLCCLVVLCCCIFLSFCGAVYVCLALLWPVVPCCVVLLVVCAVLCPVVVSVCCGALSLPAGTRINIDYDPVLPRARLRVVESRR